MSGLLALLIQHLNKSKFKTAQKWLFTTTKDGLAINCYHQKDRKHLSAVITNDSKGKTITIVRGNIDNFNFDELKKFIAAWAELAKYEIK